MAGKRSLWMMADRQLTETVGGRPNGARTTDTVKLVSVETEDGPAIISYAGLGATAMRTPMSQWIFAVLRGRKLSLEQTIVVLAEAAAAQTPRTSRVLLE